MRSEDRSVRVKKNSRIQPVKTFKMTDAGAITSNDKNDGEA